MKRLLLLASICAVPLLFPVAASAGEITHRELNQQRRIYTGVQNDSLTRQEFRNLESRERALEARRYRDVHDGNGLQPREALRLDRQQDRLSRSIYRDKHN